MSTAEDRRTQFREWYADGWSFADIARLHGITRERVRQIIGDHSDIVPRHVCVGCGKTFFHKQKRKLRTYCTECRTCTVCGKRLDTKQWGVQNFHPTCDPERPPLKGNGTSRSVETGIYRHYYPAVDEFQGPFWTIIDGKMEQFETIEQARANRLAHGFTGDGRHVPRNAS